MHMQSLPTRERGLKPTVGKSNIESGFVAPYAGAWIETKHGSGSQKRQSVAPYAGAWIETIYGVPSAWSGTVAPYAGAWIETW